MKKLVTDGGVVLDGSLQAERRESRIKTRLWRVSSGHHNGTGKLTKSVPDASKEENASAALRES